MAVKESFANTVLEDNLQVAPGEGAGLVAGCEVSQCTYNAEGACHAIAIAIAAGAHPVCGTFLKSSSRSGTGKGEAHVGTCKSSACRHNSDSRCSAPSVRVGYFWGHVDCRAFATR